MKYTWEIRPVPRTQLYVAFIYDHGKCIDYKSSNELGYFPKRRLRRWAKSRLQELYDAKTLGESI